MDYVQPVFYSGIKEYSEFSYYVDRYHEISENLIDFYKGYQLEPCSKYSDDYEIKNLMWTSRNHTSFKKLNKAKIEQIGTPSEIYDSHQSRFVADFIGLSDFLQGTVSTIQEISRENYSRLFSYIR